MAMAFTEKVDAAEPTHKLVTRNLPDVKDWDETGWVTVENQATGILMDYGTAVHLQLDPKHNQFDTVRSELTRVESSERIFVGSGREFRASLPENRALVESLLEISSDDTDAWTDRTFYVDEFAILAEQSWVYRSVPHEPHIREINASEHEGLIEELDEMMAQLRGTAVVPFDGLASWTVGGIKYELRWDSLYRSFEENSVSYDVERLEQVTALCPENCLRLDWRSNSEESFLRRTMWRILDSETAAPPTQVDIPAGEAGEKVFAAFRQLHDDLDYDYEIQRSSRS
ncbi:hypothetical protein [Natronorubrum halophilum]|uniref:hypothetical protein n=1 Tax=Natronorubrum halophilum TaxID=1702106 RepID=UPI001EE87920|nr:hypothetical protein [Natronorubrum halophilum]